MTILKGGPADGTRVTGSAITSLWITVYTFNGNLWDKPHGLLPHQLPAGLKRHGYRKQKDGNFHYAWTRED